MTSWFYHLLYLGLFFIWYVFGGFIGKLAAELIGLGVVGELLCSLAGHGIASAIYFSTWQSYFDSDYVKRLVSAVKTFSIVLISLALAIALLTIWLMQRYGQYTEDDIVKTVLIYFYGIVCSLPALVVSIFFNHKLRNIKASVDSGA